MKLVVLQIMYAKWMDNQFYSHVLSMIRAA